MNNKPLKEPKIKIEFIKGFFTKHFKLNLAHNTGTKVISLLLAVFFWFFVMDQVDPEITRIFENVPVNFINQEDLDQSNLKIMNQYDYLVNVEVKGRRNDVLNMTSKNINLWADMRTLRSGINNVYINRSINSNTVSIKEVLPNEIVLTVERIVSVPKPIKVIYNDSFQTNYYEIEKSIRPDEIRIVGPESIVNSVEYLGAYVNVGTFTKDIEKEISLAPYNSAGEIVSGVTIDKSTTTLSLKLGLEKTVPIKPIVEGQPLEGVSLTSVKAIPENIIIYGPASIVSEIDEILTEPIKLKGDESSKFSVNTKLVLPNQISHTLENGIQVELGIEQISNTSFEFTKDEIEWVNLNEKLKIQDLELLPPIKIQMVGIESVLSQVTKDLIKPYVTLTDILEPGKYKILVQFKTVEGIEMVSVPEALELIIVSSEDNE